MAPKRKKNDPESSAKKKCLAVDAQVPNANLYHVVGEYSASLDQATKFYIIQILCSTVDGQYATWNRWGKKGQNGQSKLSKFGKSIDKAEKDFKKKFEDKTGNAWAGRAEFEAVPGMYALGCVGSVVESVKGKHVASSAHKSSYASTDASTDAKGSNGKQHPASKAAESGDANIKKSKGKQVVPKVAKSKKLGREQKSVKYAVDTLVPNSGAYRVVDGFACTLNQTNIGDNNNKFYIIQLLQDSTHDEYATWNRWGRVGEPGQSKLSTFGMDLSAAEKDFAKKFLDKTKNAWPIQGQFKAVQGKYHLLEMDKEQTKKSDDKGASDAPLGKLSEPQIHKGSAVLTQLDAILQTTSPSLTKVESMSSEFYTLIPHAFGRARPPSINTPSLVEEKRALLNFYLRMGFSAIEVDNVEVSPIPGVLDGVAPATLKAAIGGRHLCFDGEIAMADRTGNQCKQKKAGSPVVPMGKHLYAAIILYTGNAIYKDLNTSLRNKITSKCSAYTPYLRLLIDAARCLPAKACEVWRGISVDLYNEYTVGLEMTWWQVSSCTSDRDVAFNFARSCENESTLLTIRTKSARNISCVTLYPHEQENILLPGTQVRVIKRERKEGMALITLEETGSAL